MEGFRKRFMAFGLSMAVGSSALVGCGSSGADASKDTNVSSVEASVTETAQEPVSGDQVTITFSLWDEIQSVVYQELIDNFEAQNPDIKVEMQLTPWDQYWTKFDAAAGANQAADVFFMNVWVPKYAEAGVLEPLDDYMERDGFDSSLYSSSIMENSKYNGVHYTVPKGTDSLAVILNTALFEKYGVEMPDNDWTWDDMVSICETLKEKINQAGDSVYPLSLMLNSTNGSWQPIVYQFGGTIFNEDGTSAYSNEKDIEAIQEIVDMIDAGLIPDYQMISDTSAEEFFISGQACMLYLPTFSSQKIEQAKMENVKLIQIPTAESKAFIAGNMHYGMNSSSQHKEEAWKFLQYLASEEANDIIGKSGIDLPARISSQTYYAESFKQFDGTAFVEDLSYAVPYVSAPASVSDSVNSITSDGIMNIFTKQIGVTEGMEKMTEDINAEIQSVS
ncbi:MAG: sugar ABC transporter substrate-binding protein [Eubacteriales bacterium]|nr:sugar ABC transporter substrate-binding protein [Eubacteriales bacterium]